MKKLFSFWFILPVLFSCSGNNESVSMECISVETICRLDESETLVGNVGSLCMIDSTRFAIVSNYEKVLLFDKTGHLIRQIGTPGNANYEYNKPMIVRSNGKFIFVWSAHSGRFICFTTEGEPIEQYTYRSAVRDFIVSDSQLFIYTSGNRKERIIDIFDMAESKVVQALSPSSDIHQTQLSWVSCAPMTIVPEGLLYMPMDELRIVLYNERLRTENTLTTIQSKTFHIEEAKYSKLSTKEKLSILDKNSHPAVLSKIGNNIGLFVLEGDGENNGWFYSSYLIHMDGSYSQKFIDYESLTSPYLFSYSEGYLYFIKRVEKGDDEEYWLLRTNDF